MANRLVTFGLKPDALDQFVRLGLDDNEGGAGGGGGYVTLGTSEVLKRFLLFGLEPTGGAQGGSYVTFGTGQQVARHLLLGLLPGGSGVAPGTGTGAVSFSPTGASWRQHYGKGTGFDEVSFQFVASGTATGFGLPLFITTTPGLVSWQGRAAGLFFGNQIITTPARYNWLGRSAQISFQLPIVTSPGLVTWQGRTVNIQLTTPVDCSQFLIEWRGTKAVVSGTGFPKLRHRPILIRGKRYIVDTT